jgi:hypothetical protein
VIEVGRIDLRLPPGFEGRAAGIARALAAALAPLGGETLALEHLRLEPLRIAAGASDGDIVRALAEQVARQLEGARR